VSNEFERPIHNELLRRAEAGLDTVTDSWRKFGKVLPFMLSWPAEDISDDKGVPITDVVAVLMPDSHTEWSQHMRKLVLRTKPYALLLCEQREREVVVIFESQHGTKSWHFPIITTGNSFLGNRTAKTDVESIGILWRAGSRNA